MKDQLYESLCVKIAGFNAPLSTTFQRKLFQQKMPFIPSPAIRVEDFVDAFKKFSPPLLFPTGRGERSSCEICVRRLYKHVSAIA